MIGVESGGEEGLSGVEWAEEGFQRACLDVEVRECFSEGEECC